MTTKAQDLLKLAESTGEKTITLVVKDADGSLERMLEHIKKIANVGHSFEVLVDPDGDIDQKKSFGIDGDGAFFLKSIKVTQ